MCSTPNTIHDENGQAVKVACRSCNDCISARKNDWVARCVAEKASAAEVVVIDLTYRNNEDGTLPDQAKAFRYKDVQNFLKLLRKAYKKAYNADGEIRYIVAGERGSDKNRVHWHMVLFSDRPISTLGEWTDFIGKPLEAMRMRKLDHWSFWPHGAVYCRVPDQGGIAYVLKYCLKDQFNVVKSKGTMREAKANNHGSSFFRMSKKPPIGERFLLDQLERWRERKAVPPHLLLKVPDLKGYWYPKGRMREILLTGLHQINQEINEELGRDAPQWSSLIASVVEQEKDLEDLFYGPEKEGEVEDFDAIPFGKEIAERSEGERLRQEVRECLGPSVCRKCWKGLDPEQRRDFKAWYQTHRQEYERTERGRSFSGWYRATYFQINPFCQLSDHPARSRIGAGGAFVGGPIARQGV